MSLLAGLEVVQLGGGMAAAVCGRVLADVGAEVTCIGPDTSTHLSAYLNHGKKIPADGTTGIRTALATASLIVCEGRPRDLRALGYDVDSLRLLNATAALVYISPFGQTGPKSNVRRPISHCSSPAALPVC